MKSLRAKQKQINKKKPHTHTELMVIMELTSCKEPGGQGWLDLVSSHKYGGTLLFQSRARKAYSVNLKIRKKTQIMCVSGISQGHFEP